MNFKKAIQLFIQSRLAVACATLFLSVMILGSSYLIVTAHATPLSECDLKISGKAHQYTGTDICPKVSITHGDEVLEEGKDYDITYRNNVEPGTAKASIAGRGLYRGHIKESYAINVDPIKNLDVEYVEGKNKDKKDKKDDSVVNVSWDDSNACDYYILSVADKEKKNSKSEKKTFKTTKNSLVLKDLKDPGAYSISVVAVAGRRNSKSPAETTSLYIDPLKQPVIAEVTSPGAGRIDVTWEAVPKAQSYEVKEVSESNGDVETYTVPADSTKASFLGKIKGNSYSYTVTAKATLDGREYASSESESKSASSTTPRIGQATNGEGGKLSGARAGDQSGGECSTGKWSYSSRGGAPYNWRYVARFKDDQKAIKAAEAMIAACENNHIGYDQRPAGGRGELKNLAAAANWDMSAITTNCETSCSPLVFACVSCAGVDVPAPGSTGDSDFLSPLRNSGEFEIITDSKYTSSDKYLQQGDILVSPGHHTCMVI